MKTFLTHFNEAYDAANESRLEPESLWFWKGYLSALVDSGQMTQEQKDKFIAVLSCGTVQVIQIDPKSLDSATASLLRDAGVVIE